MTDRESKTGWDEYLHWAGKFVSDPHFEADERTYKILAVEPLQAAAAALSGEGDWYERLRQGFQNPNNNLVGWRASQPFLEWANVERPKAAEALTVLWSDSAGHGSERIDAFDALVPQEVLTRPGVLCNLAAYLLGAMNPVRWPNYRITALDLAYELARFPGIPTKSSPGEHYGHALSFFDATIDEGEKRGIAVKDRLDAQGAMWVIAGGGARGPYGLSADEWSKFEEFVEIPSAIRKEQAQKVARAPQQKKRPTNRMCPLCGHDDEVRLVGPEGDQWRFECSGDSHSEPYSFLRS